MGNMKQRKAKEVLQLAPESGGIDFEIRKLDEEAEKAVVIQPEGGPECVEEAIDTCPVECIRWEDA